MNNSKTFEYHWKKLHLHTEEFCNINNKKTSFMIIILEFVNLDTINSLIHYIIYKIYTNNIFCTM